jgi:hypothetical protein
VFVPEVYDGSQPAGSQWFELAPDNIIRHYHSTALLLPSGKVLTGGGEYRRYMAETGGCMSPMMETNPNAKDYRVFVPDYIECGNPRPVITGLRDAATGQAITVLRYEQQYFIDFTGLPAEVSAGKVVLMRPGAVTHHSDGNQRCVQLDFIHSDSGVRIFMPSETSGTLPRGHYMMFVVSNQTVRTQGVPSEAKWVEVRQ